MTAKQKAYRASLLRQIHTTLRYRHTFAQDRELWETFLTGHYHVSSSADLSIEDLIKLLAYLQGGTSQPAVTTASQAQTGYILTQWQERSIYKDLFSLLRFAKRILRREVDDLSSLTRSEAGKLIGAIKGLKKREAVNDVGYRPST
jgi:hypothetical protein